MMEYISVAPTLTLLIAIFWIIFAPIFFYKIFQPCWECHGFESTMAHEVGHVLGFHHPDAEWRHSCSMVKGIVELARPPPLVSLGSCLPAT